jgi:hypothetical protein
MFYNKFLKSIVQEWKLLLQVQQVLIEQQRALKRLNETTNSWVLVLETPTTTTTTTTIDMHLQLNITVEFWKE